MFTSLEHLQRIICTNGKMDINKKIKCVYILYIYILHLHSHIYIYYICILYVVAIILPTYVNIVNTMPKTKQKKKKTIFEYNIFN